MRLYRKAICKSIICGQKIFSEASSSCDFRRVKAKRFNGGKNFFRSFKRALDAICTLTKLLQMLKPLFCYTRFFLQRVRACFRKKKRSEAVKKGVFGRVENYFGKSNYLLFSGKSFKFFSMRIYFSAKNLK